MKTTNHTPGQWLAHIDIDPNDSGLNDIRILEPSTETENLTANTIAVLNQNMGREAIANANLIAAAPDLLSALRFLLADYIAINGEKLTGSSVPADMARAAIEKAEGAK
jgi:hypothetical protein